MAGNYKYVVITPVRNEEEYIEKTVVSMVAQIHHPVEWIIVDDGSSDRTVEIVEEFQKKNPWITLVKRKDRGFRKQGGGVIEAFYDGLRVLKDGTWDFVVKLDGDLSFESDYFMRIFEQFFVQPDLGIAGGLIYNSNGMESWVEKNNDPKFHVRGATKVYRRSCWEDIGELLCAPGWDTLDEVKANMNGWKTQTLREIPIIHHRYTGMADGTWKNQVKNGRANYISGYHPLFMFLKCIKRIWQYPYLIGSLGLFWGFVSGYFFRIPMVSDPDLIKYVRQQQLRRLMFKHSIWQ